MVNLVKALELHGLNPRMIEWPNNAAIHEIINMNKKSSITFHAFKYRRFHEFQGWIHDECHFHSANARLFPSIKRKLEEQGYTIMLTT